MSLKKIEVTCQPAAWTFDLVPSTASSSDLEAVEQTASAVTANFAFTPHLHAPVAPDETTFQRIGSTSSAISCQTEDTLMRTSSSSPLIPEEVHQAKSVQVDICQIHCSASSSDPSETKSDETGSCSTTRATFNLIMTAFGVGITFLPKVFANSGWLGGICLLLLTALYTWFCCRRLYQVLVNNSSGRQVRSFAELGEVTFGRIGRNVFLFLNNFILFSVGVYMIDLQTSAAYFLTGGSLNVMAWRWLANAPMIVLAWVPSLKEVGIFSVGGMLATLGLMAMIATSSATFMHSSVWDGGEVMISGPGGEKSSAPLEYSEGPQLLLPFCSAICQAMLAFSVTPTTPDIVHSMRTPGKFGRVSSVTFVVIAFVYLVVACAGYAAFGNNVDGNVISSITLQSEAVPSLSALNTVLQIVVICLCFSNTLVILAPLAKDVECFATAVLAYAGEKPSEADQLPSIHNQTHPGEASTPWRVTALRSLARSSIVVAEICVTTAIQAGGDRMTAFMTLVGGLAVMPITVMIPLCCYWRTLQQTQARHPNLAVLVLEVLLMLFSLGCAGLMLADFATQVA